MSAISFLQDVRKRMLKLQPDKKNLGDNPIFCEDVQTLDGFRVGFMRHKLFKTLCAKHDLHAENAEAIFMQASAPTTPHVHHHGRSTFLPLGPDDGFEKGGGTFIGPYNGADSNSELGLQVAVPGAPFVLEPDVIHFFVPGKASALCALAFVQPRIARGDGNFDIQSFEGRSVRYADDGLTATIC